MKLFVEGKSLPTEKEFEFQLVSHETGSITVYVKQRGYSSSPIQPLVSFVVDDGLLKLKRHNVTPGSQQMFDIFVRSVEGGHNVISEVSRG